MSEHAFDATREAAKFPKSESVRSMLSSVAGIFPIDSFSSPCVSSNGADFYCPAMVQRERVFRHECGATHAPLRVDDWQFALGFESANLTV
jgi:hypothetical protein